MSGRSATAAIIFVAGLACGAPCATAGHARHTHSIGVRGSAVDGPAHRDTIGAGRTRDTPFDNQVRKMTDPLNANGAK